MKIFSDFSHYDRTARYNLNSISKSLSSFRPAEERRQVHGNWIEDFEYEPAIQKADVCLLAYFWSHYVNTNTINQAQAEVDRAREHGKPLVIFNGGDYPANIPFKDVILLESAGYRSTPGLLYHSAQPSYIPDYLQTYCGVDLILRQKQETPLIGFCGQASASPFQTAYRTLRLKWRQRQYRIGRLKWEPPPFETTSFRTRVLKQFQGKAGVQTNFLIRSKYRAGETKDKSLQNPAKVAFANNILNSDYTLCMRGGGNFSVRFYETLCLGRIPIFIDTDCLLPFQDQIDYKALFPWIDISDLPHAAEIVRDFHARLSAEDFLERQKACRQLWLAHMTPDGFHQDFIRTMQLIIKEGPTKAMDLVN